MFTKAADRNVTMRRVGDDVATQGSHEEWKCWRKVNGEGRNERGWRQRGLWEKASNSLDHLTVSVSVGVNTDVRRGFLP